MAVPPSSETVPTSTQHPSRHCSNQLPPRLPRQDPAGVYHKWAFSLLRGVLDHEHLPPVWDCVESGKHGAVAECFDPAEEIAGGKSNVN